MTTISTITSKTLVLSAANIDTDQIIPARYLTATSQKGLGQFLFYDWRFDENGKANNHILNHTESSECKILVGGTNFGSGSSREHAPWALVDYGFQVIISSEIADIFRGNAVKNGLLPVVIEKAAHDWLLDNPSEEITVDLKACQVRLPKNGGDFPFEIDAFARHCLMQGLDETAYLGKQLKTILEFELTHRTY